MKYFLFISYTWTIGMPKPLNKSPRKRAVQAPRVGRAKSLRSEPNPRGSVQKIERSGPEIVIGLVGAVGAPLSSTAKALEDALLEVDYRCIHLRLIELIKDLEPWALESVHGEDAEMDARMDCGDNCRRTLKRKDALSLFAIAAIQNHRKEKTGFADKAIARTAYVLRSLKTPEEVECLRKTYGDSCYILAVYCPHDTRRKNLAKRIGDSHHSEGSHYLSASEGLIERDMRDAGDQYGQNLRDTFPEADVFLDGTSNEELTRNIRRFIEVLFGHPFRTPTREEVGMFHAYGAKLRSAQAGRQVGASITRLGDVVCVGTNEVASAFGGQYWEYDKRDGRDHQRPDDSTQALTQSLFADLLARLRKKGWLADDKKSLSIKQLLEDAKEQSVLRRMVLDKDDPPSLAEKAPLLDIIEFMRAVHAEMSAITTAARHGIPLEGCVLFCTAFPCHECARHIVSAGIKEVYFIEPYPKSRVAELFDDSVSIDKDGSQRVPFRAYTGIAPQLYAKVFIASKRKDESGSWIKWDEIKLNSMPARFEPSLEGRELEWLEILNATIENNTNLGEAHV